MPKPITADILSGIRQLVSQACLGISFSDMLHDQLITYPMIPSACMYLCGLLQVSPGHHGTDSRVGVEELNFSANFCRRYPDGLHPEPAVFEFLHHMYTPS